MEAERRLTSEDGSELKLEQRKTLGTPVMPANLILRVMYLGLDLIYGFGRSLPKLKNLEILARYPYHAWELASYNRLTRRYARAAPASKAVSDRLVHVVRLGRRAQDNEQWHLMIIEDLMRQQGLKQGVVKSYLIPRALAVWYRWFARILYWAYPPWSFAMNARFESHAEHEYMRMVEEHPEWESRPVDTAYFEYYPAQASMADLFRRIGLDERSHMEESMAEYKHLTGRDLT
ncbi:MAG: alternative oxidase [Terriglobia bacterium]